MKVRDIVIGLICCFQASSLFAHGRYILPSHSNLSGDKEQVVTLTASISNDIFHPDRPLGDAGHSTVKHGLDKLFSIMEYETLLPSGLKLAGPDWLAYARYSVADVTLNESGTYRISQYQPKTKMTTFINQQGDKDRRMGNTPLPDGAAQIKRLLLTLRTDIYVTKNQITPLDHLTTGKGLELVAGSHPNDLFVNEDVHFQFQLHGKPLSERVSVSLVYEDTRFRNQREAVEYTTDRSGAISLSFDKPGRYLLEAIIKRKTTDVEGIDILMDYLFCVLEVQQE